MPHSFWKTEAYIVVREEPRFQAGLIKGPGQRAARLPQQNPEPADQAAEVVADSGEDGVIGVAAREPEIVAGHAVLGLEMANNGLDGGPTAELALDLRRHPSLLAGEE